MTLNFPITRVHFADVIFPLNFLIIYMTQKTRTKDLTLDAILCIRRAL